MYYNGQGIRLLPEEMIKIFGRIFSNSFGNDKFIEQYDKNQEMKRLMESISKILRDTQYQMFRQKYGS